MYILYELLIFKTEECTIFSVTTQTEGNMKSRSKMKDSDRRTKILDFTQVRRIHGKQIFMTDYHFSPPSESIDPLPL